MLPSLFLLIHAAAGAADPVVHSVICSETAFSRAAEQRDHEAFVHLIDEEARFITGDVLRGPDDIGEAWREFFAIDGPAIRWRPQIVEVVAGGSLAISRGPYRIRDTDEAGEARESWGTFASVWRRQDDGEWKVLFDAGGDAGKTPTDDERRILEGEPDCAG